MTNSVPRPGERREDRDEVLPRHHVFFEVVPDRQTARIGQREERRLRDVQVDHLATDAKERAAGAGDVALRVGAVGHERGEPVRPLGQPALDIADVLLDECRELRGVVLGARGALLRFVLASRTEEADAQEADEAHPSDHGSDVQRAVASGANRACGHRAGYYDGSGASGPLLGSRCTTVPASNPALPPAPGLPARARLGRYELCAKIADGGMAVVHVARVVEGPGAGDVVAIKTIRDEFARNRDFVTMFMDEAEIVGRLRHPNVLRYHELGNDRGQLFLSMELLYGQSLWGVWEACRSRGVRLRYPMIAWVGARIADGLHYARTSSGTCRGARFRDRAP